MLFLKKAPFIKLILSLIAGILLQWQFNFPIFTISIAVAFSSAFIFSYSVLPVTRKFFVKDLTGLLIVILTASAGSLSVYLHDIRNTGEIPGKLYKPGDTMVAQLEEPLTEKPKSYKSIASLLQVLPGSAEKVVQGRILVYFKKTSSAKTLKYGSVIVFRKPLQKIKNSGNPGEFDYERYCLFRGMTQQLFLSENDFIELPVKNKNGFRSLLFAARKTIADLIPKYIPGKREQGLAEALLIGYREDLDRTLVQSYANTGVVHIIAISGMHLGIIYGLLLFLLKPLQKRKNAKWFRVSLVIVALWLFSLIAGGSSSVIRSAVMFSCIILSESIGRKSSIYNTLAFSAFLLLCYNPFWLWEAGFQLSYAAVLSIVLFFRPVYNWFYIKNKTLDFFWKVNAVTIAAQVLTVPLGIYHFHQFPNYFLLANIIAVPLSGLILTGEILLCASSFIPAASAVLGKLIAFLIYIMNTWVEKVNALPFPVWGSLNISVLQTILVFISILGGSGWLLEKNKKGLFIGLFAFLVFTFLRALSFYTISGEGKIIVYAIPKHTAVDLINGFHVQFIGDPEPGSDGALYNYYIKPSRIYYRANKPASQAGPGKYRLVQFNGKKILILSSGIQFYPLPKKEKVDLLIVSKNPGLYFSTLVRYFNITQVVFDASNPYQKLNAWKRDCDALHIPWYDVSEKGAFVMRVN